MTVQPFLKRRQLVQSTKEAASRKVAIGQLLKAQQKVAIRQLLRGQKQQRCTLTVFFRKKKSGSHISMTTQQKQVTLVPVAAGCLVQCMMNIPEGSTLQSYLSCNDWDHKIWGAFPPDRWC